MLGGGLKTTPLGTLNDNTIVKMKNSIIIILFFLISFGCATKSIEVSEAEAQEYNKQRQIRFKEIKEKQENINNKLNLVAGIDSIFMVLFEKDIVDYKKFISVKPGVNEYIQNVCFIKSNFLNLCYEARNKILEYFLLRNIEVHLIEKQQNYSDDCLGLGPYVFNLEMNKEEEIIGLRIKIDIEGFQCIPNYWELEKLYNGYVIKTK